MYIKSVKNCKRLKGKKVLLRASLNVPIKNGKISDSFRLDKQLATIRFLRIQGAKIIIIGHLGRPTPGEYDSKYSLLPVVRYLEKKLATKINFVPGEINIQAGNIIAKMKEGDITVLDNLRFNAGEKKNTALFAKILASFADIYVCDAFANAHRAHASMDKIKMKLPAYAGLLLEQEVANLASLMRPKQPLCVVLGGAKINTKLPLVNQFKNKAENIIIGGALANNFLKAKGYEVGLSLVDEESLKFAKNYRADNLLLPIDVVVTKDDKSTRGTIKMIGEVEKDDYIFDIGPQSVRLFASNIRRANTIIWNGPMGFFETKAFAHGSLGVCEAIASRSRGRCFGVVGGGETVEVLKMTKSLNNIDWVSTGGGAMLSFLGGKKMPGLAKIVS